MAAAGAINAFSVDAVVVIDFSVVDADDDTSPKQGVHTNFGTTQPPLFNASIKNVTMGPNQSIDRSIHPSSNKCVFTVSQVFLQKLLTDPCFDRRLILLIHPI